MSSEVCRQPYRQSLMLLALFLFSLLAALATPSALGEEEALPDLVVVDLRVGEGQRGHVFTVEVRNDGGAFEETLRVIVSNQDTGSGRVVYAEPVPPGATRNVTVSSSQWYYGSIPFRVTLDRWDDIPETNESNNGLDRRFGFGSPELRFNGFKAEAPVVVDAPVLVSVLVKNEGNATAHDVPFQISDVNGNRSSGRIERIPPGASGKGFVHWWVARESATDLSVAVDPEARLPDADRADNNKTVQLGPASIPAPVIVDGQQLWSNTVEVFSNTTQYVIDYYGTFTGDHVPKDARAVLYDGDQQIASKSLGLKWQNGTLTTGARHDAEGLSWYSTDKKDVYNTGTSLKFHHTVDSDHAPRYALEIHLEPDRPWNTTFHTEDTQPPFRESGGSGGGGGGAPAQHQPSPPPPPPPPSADDSPPDPMLSFDGGLFVLEGEMRVNTEMIFAVEIRNEHDTHVTVDVHWAVEREPIGRISLRQETVTVPPGRTNVTLERFLEEDTVDDRALVATMVEPGTPFSEIYPSAVFHDDARMVLQLQFPDEHLEIQEEVQQRPTPFGSQFVVHVRANHFDAPMTRLVIIDDGGHFVRVEDFPVDLAAGQEQSFNVIVEPRGRNATGNVVVQAVSAGSESAPVTLHMDMLVQSEPPAVDPVPMQGQTVFVIVLVGTGTMGALGGAFLWANESRRLDLLRRLLQSGVGLALFSRIQGNKTLEHGTREEIHRLVNERPGIHYREILRTLRLSNGRLAHHLQTLERESLIRSQKDGRLVRFFAARAASRVGDVLTPRQASILTHVRRRPGILQSELVKVLGVSRQALHQQVTALREAGLLISSSSGRTNALYLEADVDRRICRCPACDTRYDRGGESLQEVLCPSCGTA